LIKARKRILLKQTYTVDGNSISFNIKDSTRVIQFTAYTAE